MSETLATTEIALDEIRHSVQAVPIQPVSPHELSESTAPHGELGQGAPEGVCPFMGRLAMLSPDAAQRFRERSEAGKKHNAEMEHQRAQQATADARKVASEEAKTKRVEDTKLYENAKTKKVIKESSSESIDETIEVAKPVMLSKTGVTESLAEKNTNVEPEEVQIEQKPAPAVVVAEATPQALQSEVQSSKPVETQITNTEGADRQFFEASASITSEKPAEVINTPPLTNQVAGFASAAVTEAFSRLANVVESAGARVEPANMGRTEIPETILFSDVASEIDASASLPAVQVLEQSTIDTTFAAMTVPLETGVDDIYSTEYRRQTEFDDTTIETFEELNALLTEQSSGIQTQAETLFETEPSESLLSNQLDILALPIELSEQNQDTFEASGEAVVAAYPLEPIQAFELITAALDPTEVDHLDTELALGTIEQAPVEPLALETIIYQADERPPQETLAQLVTALPEIIMSSMSSEEQPGIVEAIDLTASPEQAAAQEVVTALQELEAAIAASLSEVQQHSQPLVEFASDTSDEVITIFDQSQSDQDLETALDPRIQQLSLTPLVTEKIINLLRAIGYEEPQDALLELAEIYGVDVTLQAFQHIASLVNKQEYREILAFSTSSNVSDSKQSTSARIGSALLWLLRSKPSATLAAVV
jgi:hypothetical protein